MNDSIKDISSPLVHMKTHKPKERGRPSEVVLFCEKVSLLLYFLFFSPISPISPYTIFFWNYCRNIL